jgi:chromate transporter
VTPLLLFLYFLLLSLLSVGGVNTVIPEMQRIVVETEGWISAAEFTQLFALSQAAPGPNVLITSLIGWKVAGLAGALIALGGFCLPAGALAYWVGGVWERFRHAPWRIRIQRALVPVTIGLVFAGGYVLATPDGIDWRNALIAALSATVICATRLNPLWILSGGAIAGYLAYA